MDSLVKVKKGDIVLHTLSNLNFRCENAKHERWMNMNPYYVLVSGEVKIVNYSNNNSVK